MLNRGASTAKQVVFLISDAKKQQQILQINLVAYFF